MLKKGTLFLLFFTVVCALKAQNDTLQFLPTAKVTAQRINRFSIGQMTVEVDSFTLKNYRNRSLSDFLTMESALSVKNIGTGIANISARGLGSSHNTLVWNGLNIQNTCNGGIDVSIIPMNGVNRVALKMGGGSALYGSGAMGSILFLDNDKPEKVGWSSAVGYSLGAFGFENKQVQVDYSQQKMAFSFLTSKQKAENDFIFKNTAEIGQPERRVTNAAFENFNLQTHFFYTPTSKDFIKINVWRSINFREIAPTMISSSANAYFRDTANRITADWSHFFKKGLFKTKIGYIKDKNFYESDLIKNSQNGSKTFISETSLDYDFAKNHSLRFGLNVTNDESDNNNYLSKHQRTRIALFLNEAYRTDFMRWTANVRQEWIGKFVPVTFSAGAEKPFLKEKYLLRAAFSRNYNIPSFNDLYWKNLGNPLLIAEKGWSKELGIRFRHAKKFWAIESNIGIFDTRVTDRIVWLPQSDGQFRPFNINKIISQGVEYQGFVSYFKEKINSKINFNYQLARATDGAGGVPLYTPVHKGSVGVWCKYKSLYMTWQQTASSKRYAATDKSIWTKAFTTADAAIGFNPKFGKKWKNISPDLKLQVFNIFDKDYQIIPFYPNPKRQIRVEMSLFF